MFSLRVFNNNPSSPSAAPPLWKPVTSGASGNQPRPWYIDYPQPQPSSSCPAVLSSMLSLSSGAAGQQQDFGLPLTNKTPQLLTACKIRSRARSTTHARTQTHTNRHTEIHTHRLCLYKPTTPTSARNKHFNRWWSTPSVIPRTGPWWYRSCLRRHVPATRRAETTRVVWRLLFLSPFYFWSVGV